MFRYRPTYPPEFRRQMVDLVRSGEERAVYPSCGAAPRMAAGGYDPTMCNAYRIRVDLETIVEDLSQTGLTLRFLENGRTASRATTSAGAAG